MAKTVKSIKANRPEIGINEGDYILITHNQPEITTFGDLFSSSVVLLKNISVNSLANYKSRYSDPDIDITNQTEINNFLKESEITNRERIFQKYTKEEKTQYSSTLSKDLPLKLGTRLAIPKENITQESLFQQYFETNKYYEVKPFLSERLSELLRDVRYVNALPKHTGEQSGLSKTIIPNITVFVWCKAINKVLNISPFVENLQVTNSMDGASFNIRLAPILGVFDNVEKIWKINESSINSYYYGGIRSDYIARSYLTREDSSQRRVRPSYFFHQVIAPNDLVFIRFETLEIEKEKRIRQGESFEIGLDQLPGNLYDLIGLVDGNAVSTNASTTDITIDITGRDLTKLIIDDGTFFFPLEFASGVVYNAGQRDTENGKIISRFFTDGELLSLNAFLYRSIDFSIKFIINQMSTTGIIPSDIFKHFPNRSKRFRLQKNKNQKQKELEGDPILQEVEGLWQIINLVIDSSVRERRIADDSIASDQGSIINFINKFCQKPFVEFYTDTYQDRFYFIIRQPPFDKVKYTGLVYDDIQIEETVLVEKNVVYYDKQAVEARENAPFRTEDAPANLLPEVQIKTITYPETVTKTEQRLSDILLTITDDDVYAESLVFSDNEVYSWYTITPQSFMFGNEALSLYYFPAVVFPEYQELYGAKSYSINSIYHVHEAYKDAESTVNLSRLERQIFYDLRYMIESTMYLPFVRSGSITINGDRRIKKGTCIYYEPTSEVFYVNGVIHSYSINNGSIDRFTVLNVERGMRQDYILGKNETLVEGEPPVFVSYFNIINLEIDESVLKSEKDFEGDNEATINKELRTRFHQAIKDWKVNKQVFDFFVKRMQFK